MSTIIGTETKIVKQVSSWRSAGITWVRLRPKTADGLPRDGAKSGSLTGVIAIYLILEMLDIAYDIEELMERIGHDRVAENLNSAGMNSTNSVVNSEESELVWTVLCQAMTLKSVRKAYPGWTDQDSEDQKCFNCVPVRNGDRVINVECTKQEVIEMSATQSESYTLTTGEFGRVPSEDNETDLSSKCVEQDHNEKCMTKM